MGAMKTQFNDAIETSVPKGSQVNDKNSPSAGASPMRTMFSDALETKVPNTRTGGALPERLLDNNIAAPVPDLPEPGKTFKIG